MPVTRKLGKFGLTGINCIFLVLPRYINLSLSLTLISPLLLFFSYCFSNTCRGVVSQDKPYFAHQSFPFHQQQQRRLETQPFTSNPSARHKGLSDIILSYLYHRHSHTISYPLYLTSPSRRVSPVHQNHLLLHLQPIINPTTFTKDEPQRIHNGSRTPSSRLRAYPSHLLSSTP